MSLGLAEMAADQRVGAVQSSLVYGKMLTKARHKFEMRDLKTSQDQFAQFDARRRRTRAKEFSKSLLDKAA